MPWCPNCDEIKEIGNNSCPVCGAELIIYPTCPKCGRKFEDGTEFCPEDGGEVFPKCLIKEGIQRELPLPLTKDGLAQTKFSLLPNEKVVIEGRFTYYYKLNSLVKGGTTYLTQFRLVFCNNHSILFPVLFAGVGGFLTKLSGNKSDLWFLLFYLVAYAICIARKATKITFQIPISQIKSINRKKYGFGSKYTILTDAGVQYVVQFTKENKWKSAIGSLGINIESLTKKGKPVDRDLGEAAAPETAGPTERETAATSPAGIGERGLARKLDWTPVLILIAVMVMALGAGVYFWRSYQPAPPKKQEVKKAIEKPLAKTEIPKPEVKPVEPVEPAPQLSAKDYFNWVYVGSYENFTQYYNSSSAEIDKQDKIIKVWVKHAYTEKGKIRFLKNYEGIEKQKYIDIDYELIFLLFNYNKHIFNIKSIAYYSKSGNVLLSTERNIWDDIPPKSMGDILLNKIIKDYNIQR